MTPCCHITPEVLRPYQIGLLIILTLCLLSTPVASAKEPALPNIVFILADDKY
jgi:hypothetical protein